MRVLRLDDAKSRRLAHLALHKRDLEFALACLEGINLVPALPFALRQGLWRSAVIHFSKCFGTSAARFSLEPKSVYKGATDALDAYEYFKIIRNKHLVHDQNSYAQCLPGAVLNKPQLDHKIAKIICLSAVVETLDQGAYGNLHLLVTRAREWVTAQFDELCSNLTKELEQKTYEELVSLPAMTYSFPKLEEITETRK